MDQQQPQLPKTTNNLVKQLTLGALIVIIYFGVTWYNKTTQAPEATKAPVVQTPKTEQSTPTTTTNTTIQTEPTKISSVYKDGTYTVAGNYISPGGAEEIDVTLTIANDVITDSNLEPKATLQASVKFQNQFAQAYKTQVVGKKLSELSLSKVAGASLTTQGFNNALEKIKAQSKF